jgi:hypothetical protein
MNRKIKVAAVVVFVLTAILIGCGRGDNTEASVFEACYKRCMSPPVSECPAEHEECIIACRSGKSAIYKAMPHFGNDKEADVNGRARLAQSVGIEVVGGEITPILRRCIDLPFEASEIFSTGEDNQPTIEVHLTAGEAQKAADNQSLGGWVFEGVRPAPRGIPKIEVRFRVEKSGRLTIGARDTDTGQALIVQQGRSL